MAHNLTIGIGADSAQLRADLALAQSELRATTAELTRTANAFRRTGDEMKGVQLGQIAAQYEGARAKVRGLSEELEHATERFRGLNLAAGGTVRELLVLAHEGLVMGNWTRFGGSMMVLTERMGGLGAMARSLMGPLGAIGGAALIAAGGVGYLAYQAYEAERNLRSMQANLLLTGRSGGVSGDDLEKMADQLADKYDLSRRSAAELLNTISAAAPLTREQIELVAELAAAEAKVRDAAGETVEYDKIGDKYAKDLAEGAKGAIKLAESFNVAATEAERLLKGGNEVGALNSALDALRRHIDENGGAWALAKSKFDEYMRAVVSSSVEGSMPNFDAFGPAPPTPTTRPSAGAGVETETPIAEARLPPDIAALVRHYESGGNYTSGYTGIDLSRAPLNQYGFPIWAGRMGPAGNSRAAGAYQFEPDTWARYAGPLGIRDFSPGSQDRVFGAAYSAEGLAPWRSNAALMQAVAQQRSGSSYTGDQSAIAVKARNEAETRAANESFAQLEVLNRHSLERQEQDAKAHYDELKKLAGGVETDPGVEAAYKTWLQKKGQLFDENTREQIAGFQDLQAKAPTAAIKAQLQQSIIDTIQKRGAMPESGGVDLRELATAQRELDRLKREAADEATRKQHQSLQQDAADATALRQRNQTLLRGNAAAQGAQVDLHKQTQADAIRNEIALTQQLAAQELTALDAIKQRAKAVGDTVEQRRVENEILGLQVDALTQLLDLDKKLADDAKKTAEAWAAPFKTAIDSIGSDLEHTLKDVFTARSSRDRGAAWQSFDKSLVGAGLDFGGSLLSKGSAALLGAPSGQGLGQFLGDKALGFLGLGGAGKSEEVTQLTIHTDLLKQIVTNTGGTSAGGAGSLAGLPGISGTPAGSALSAASSIGNAFSGVEGAGKAWDWLSGLFGGGSGSGEWSGLNGLSQAGMDANQALGAANAAAAGLSSAGGVMGGAGSFLGGLPLIGSLFSSLFALFERGGIVPSAAGGWALPRNVQPALLHAGEMVLPAHLSEGIQAAINGSGFGGGGGSNDTYHLHFHGPADGPAIERFLKPILEKMAPGAMRNAFRSNALTPRTI